MKDSKVVFFEISIAKNNAPRGTVSYKRITLAERLDIFRLLHIERLKPSQIAKLLNRKPSTITREITKGMDNKVYNPLVAEMRRLEVRKKQRPNLKMTKEAWKLVKAKLELGWPPEQIAKWLRLECPEHSMSAKTIYNYISFHMKGELKMSTLMDLLQRGTIQQQEEETDKKEGDKPA